MIHFSLHGMAGTAANVSLSWCRAAITWWPKHTAGPAAGACCSVTGRDYTSATGSFKRPGRLLLGEDVWLSHLWYSHFA